MTDQPKNGQPCARASFGRRGGKPATAGGGMPAVDDLPVSRKRSMVVGLVALGSSALAVYAVSASHRCRQDLPPDQQPGCSSPSSSNGHGSSSTSSDYSSFTIGDEAAGIGVREDVSPITKNTSRFVPHAILP